MTNETTIQIHAEGKIDIHKRQLAYERRLYRVQQSTKIIPENKELMLKFVRDCALGKTVIIGQKKRIGFARCEKYLRVLERLGEWFGKSFSAITQEDMEEFIERLEANQVLTKPGSIHTEAGKADIKRCIKKFWKWKDGKNRHYPKLVEWIDTTEPKKDVPALRKQEIESMIHFCANPRDRAFLIVLFDSGARIEELLNVRMKPEHLEWKSELGVFKIRLEFSKTKPRTISLPLSTQLLADWLKYHPASSNPLAQLFPMSYDSARQIVCRMGRKVLKKKVTPHMLRHSSATYYANKLNRYQLCYRYGWTMSSTVVDRYLDREGILEEGVNEVVKTKLGEGGQTSIEARNVELTIAKESNVDLATELAELKREIARLKEQD